MFVETGRRWIAFLANNVVGKNGWWLVAPGQYDTRGGKVVSSILSRKEKKRADTTPSSRSSAQNITMHEFYYVRSHVFFPFWLQREPPPRWCAISPIILSFQFSHTFLQLWPISHIRNFRLTDFIP